MYKIKYIVCYQLCAYIYTRVKKKDQEINVNTSYLGCGIMANFFFISCMFSKFSALNIYQFCHWKKEKSM